MEKFKTAKEWRNEWKKGKLPIETMVADAQDEVLEFLAQNAKLVYEVDGIGGTCKISIDKEFIRSLKNNNKPTKHLEPIFDFDKFKKEYKDLPKHTVNIAICDCISRIGLFEEDGVYKCRTCKLPIK